ncbi:hypothetical protein BD410DRAFT_846588 [Rickenella mellea]|uniref:Uncharacterized protein n=1 Tax=Rickenella mellea TaxID=50990 RepID=A0A4Y7PFK3_9AGAM|nr:hypothetical protein BD410DRAFT_846588 [Rickenella mellea]
MPIDDTSKMMVNRTAFTGSRLKFLHQNLEKYTAARECTSVLPFLQATFASYWRRFSWTLEETQDEPPCGHMEVVEMLENTWKHDEEFLQVPEDANDDEMSDADWVVKWTTKAAREQTISSWFYWEWSKLPMNVKADLWKPILEAPFRSTRNHPAYEAAWLVYNRLYYEDRIKDAFEEKWHAAGQPMNRRLSIRHHCAKVAFESESMEFRKAMEQKARQEHKAALRKHWQITEPSNDPDIQYELIRRIPTAVNPLLEVISEYTGMTVSLLAGKAKGNDGCIFTRAHVGGTGGEKELTWEKHDPVGWTRTVNFFASFLKHTVDHDDATAQTPTLEIEVVQPPLDIDGEEEEEEEKNDGTTFGAEDVDRSDGPSFKNSPLSRKNRRKYKMSTKEKARQKLKESLAAANGKACVSKVMSKGKGNATTPRVRQRPPTRSSNPNSSFPTPQASPIATPAASTSAIVPASSSVDACLTPEESYDANKDNDTMGETGDGANQLADGSKKWLADLLATLPTGASWDWLCRHFADLAEKNYSHEWIATLRAWVAMEELGDGEGTGNLPTANRPEWVTWWIARRRTTTTSPPIPDIPSYINQWHLWWEEVTKDSERAFRLGKNGFLSVLMTLKWWRDLGKADDLVRWHDAVTKVKATMVELRSVNHRERRKRAAPAFHHDLNGVPIRKKQK